MVFYERLFKEVHPGWQAFLEKEFEQGYFKKLISKLEEAERQQLIFPPPHLRFKAFSFLPPEETKVLILGQDPYHQPGQAHGLSFSVPAGVSFPPSLRNIFKELKNDLDIDPPFSGDLSPWAEQGVLLVNSALTVEAARAGSHLKWGWDEFSNQLIAFLSKNYQHIVFVLWGKYAQSKMPLINQDKHLILQSVHPSPLSAHRGFFGSKPFSQANLYLKSKGRRPIEWRND